MSPIVEQIAGQVRETLPACRDLLRRRYLAPSVKPSPTRGHCYIASEAVFYAARMLRIRLHPYHVNMGTPESPDTHWFLADDDDDIVDVTADQFDTPVPYHVARGCGFLTATPSIRAIILMSRAGIMFRPNLILTWAPRPR